MADTVGSVALRKLTQDPRHVTQRQIADALGVTQQAVSNWLSGKTSPDLRRLAQIQEIYGIPIADWTIAPRARRRRGDSPAKVA